MDKNSGFPNFGTVTIGSKGIHIRENSYDDGGPSPDRWFLGWGYLQGTTLQVEEHRMKLSTFGFYMYLYPKSAVDMDKWATLITQFQKNGGQNIRRRE